MRREDETLLDQFRGAGPCGFCCRWCEARHAAHVFARGMGSGGRLDIRLNVVPLCWQCHMENHAGRQPTQKHLLGIVAGRHGLTAEEVEDIIHVYRRASA